MSAFMHYMFFLRIADYSQWVGLVWAPDIFRECYFFLLVRLSILGQVILQTMFFFFSFFVQDLGIRQCSCLQMYGTIKEQIVVIFHERRKYLALTQ